MFFEQQKNRKAIKPAHSIEDWEAYLKEPDPAMASQYLKPIESPTQQKEMIQDIYQIVQSEYLITPTLQTFINKEIDKIYSAR